MTPLALPRVQHRVANLRTRVLRIPCIFRRASMRTEDLWILSFLVCPLRADPLCFLSGACGSNRPKRLSTQGDITLNLFLQWSMTTRRFLLHCCSSHIPADLQNMHA